ncbi:aminodeoxychorismate/anthranilate synthase component II [SAR202 cluster bacterium AD-802-E10_MRT_200m]|nr:aminodeoxychorismate/anthranilate synthase component II [SAR202 cluster bacterium AD-802-E10_MRT_200m]
MILLIDNYDSFTYNLYQYLSELGGEVRVERNDKITLLEVEELAPEKIVISPGPCTPLEAGISNDVIKRLGHRTPILGVCLGHQCIGYAFGAQIGRAGEIMHGKTSPIFHNGEGVLEGLTNPLQAIRYHSLAVEKNTLPSTLKITAWTEEGLIMGLRHKTYPVEGVQFHPESIMTPQGKTLLKNFLSAPYPEPNSMPDKKEGDA